MTSIEEVQDLQISLQELSDATDGFSNRNLIAKGGFGSVYKGVSVKHDNIAVKMLNPGQGQGDSEFRAEIALLSVYKHENIVSLLRFCDDDGKKILVYKYETNESLDKHLRRRDLTWIQRLQICLDAARGLQYLHHDVALQHRIIHRDVKSSNILLDKNLKAKIADFGLSKMRPANAMSTFLISNACGTIGYIDPDLLNTGYLTQKSDVYSFGVVLFEVLCGRPSIVVKYKDNRDFLTNLVRTHWRRKTLDAIIYSDIQKEIKPASLLTFKTIAYQRLMNGNERPTMKKVVEQLQKAFNNQLAPSDSWSDDEDIAAQPQVQSAELMASSSHYSPTSSSQSYNYDVFVSFRGEDTRMTFVDHLYSALVDQMIFTYRDDATLPRGESIASSLTRALQESRIAIIVFSENYASSSWCLEELRLIMENKEKRGQIVIPIFYGVEPKHVRNQTGHYRKAFDDLKLNNNEVEVEVESWIKALRNAADLTGWDMTKIRHETKALKSICEDVQYRLHSLNPPSEGSVETSGDTYLIGIETRSQELKSLLEKVGSGGVDMVGICGMWGSGKSTLASYIYDEIRHEFEGCCFVKDVRARSRMYGLKTLQEEVLSSILNLEVTLTDTEQGIVMLKSRLRKNSVLLVLDDVDHIDHLKTLAGSKKWFGKGSRILYTTRKQYLVNCHKSTTHNVRMLDDTEAIELFSRHAFGNRKPMQGFGEVSQTIVSKFSGHPSTLKGMGSFLHSRERSVWTSISDRLKSMQVDEILKRLKTRDDGVVRNIFDVFQD